MATAADVIIVGGGPAGLSAALILGRCRRRVLVYDHGAPRNLRSERLSGFLTRDGLPPRDLARLAREQLAPYDSVTLHDQEVVDAVRTEDGFEVTLKDGSRARSRKLLLATGVTDELPPIEGIDAFYGTSVWHCPICDGWEHRDQPLGVIGTGKSAEEIALKLTTWTKDLTVFTNGQGGDLKRAQRALLDRNGIAVHDGRITSLDGEAGRLQAVRFEDGTRLERKGLFFCGPERQRTDLARKLGCEFSRKGTVKTGTYETTCVPGLYVAGDADGLVRIAIVAAAEGALAGFAINTELTKEQLKR